MVKKVATISASQQRLVWARKVDDITSRIRQKIEVLSGFKDIPGQTRFAESFFLYFDKNACGHLSYPQVCTALKKMNFLGCQREVEAWFNYYDDDFTGSLNYGDFSKDAYGQADDGRPSFDFISRGIIEDVRNKMVDIGGASGFYELTRLINSRKQSNGKISRMELADVLAQYGCGTAETLNNDNLALLLKAYDPHHHSVIDADAFTNSLIKGTMSYERKLIVRETFHRFKGAADMGYVSVGELVSHFQPTYHPEVIAGIISPEAASDQFRYSFSQGQESEGYATLAEYLDYFKGISLAITDDHAFDMLMRNVIMFGEPSMDSSLSLSSSPTLRRLLVTHSDGKQEVVDLVDEMGSGRFDISTAKDRAREQGVYDIATIQL